MLTTEKINRICDNPLTSEKKVICILWRQFQGVGKVDAILPQIAMERKTLLSVHVSRSPYLEYIADGDFIKLHRRGKDIYKYGKLYDNPYQATSVKNLVFSLLYKDIDQTFDDLVPKVKEWQRMTGRPIGDFCNDAKKSEHYGFYRKLVVKWLIAKDKLPGMDI